MEKDGKGDVFFPKLFDDDDDDDETDHWMKLVTERQIFSNKSVGSMSVQHRKTWLFVFRSFVVAAKNEHVKISQCLG